MRHARSSVTNSLNLLSKDGTIQQETSALRELCIHHPQTALVKATDSGLPKPGRYTAQSHQHYPPSEPSC